MVLLGTVDAIAITTVAFLWLYVKLAIANIKNERTAPLTALHSAFQLCLWFIVTVEFLPGIVHWMTGFWNLATGLL